MNNLIASAVYKNDVTLQNGLPVLHLEIPSTSKNQQPIPIFLMQGWNMPSSVAGAFEKGTNLLVNARIYPHPDGSMYAVPTMELQKIPKETVINQVFLAGGVGFINSKYIPKLSKQVTEFGMMCKASADKRIGYTRADSLRFMLESWENDAKFLKNYLYEGRQLSVGGTLKFESYQDKEGKQCAKYKVRVRSQQYSLFGKNRESEEARKEIIETVKEIVQEAKPVQSPKSVNWQSSPVIPENDDVPF